MRLRVLFSILLLLCLQTATACGPQTLFYWGSYEDSLYLRQQHAGADGEAEAIALLLTTINDATSRGAKVGPGIHADYGYLLLKQGKAEEAIAELQKEAAFFPESVPLMNTMVSRIQGRNKNESEAKPTP